jgi:hypothetical protein
VEALYRGVWYPGVITDIRGYTGYYDDVTVATDDGKYIYTCNDGLVLRECE